MKRIIVFLKLWLVDIRDLIPGRNYKILVWRKGATRPEIFERKYDNAVQKDFVLAQVKKELSFLNWTVNDPKEYINGYRIFDLIEVEK